MKAVIAGGSGFVGKALAKHLTDQGWDVVILSRSGKTIGSARSVQWDGKTAGAWGAELEGADAVINLSGEDVSQRWTDQVRRKVIASRVEPTKAIGEAIQAAQNPPKVWINASAVGFYGETGDRVVTEASPKGTGFLPDICEKWEKAVDEFALPETRQVKMRLGIVFGREGGPLGMLNKVARAGLAAPLGTGRQFISWVHIDDVTRMMEWAIREDVAGIVNANSPNPRSNADIMGVLRDAHGRPPLPPVPEFMVKLSSGIIGIDASTLLMSTRAKPEIALARGFVFLHPDLEETIADLVGVVPEAWAKA